MPYTQRLACTEESITKALLAHGEKVGSIGIDARSKLATLKLKANEVVTNYTTPLRRNLERVLAPTGKSVDATIAELGLFNGNNKTAIEASFKSRFGLSVVNGRLLVPGKAKVEALKELYRLLGSTTAIEALIPELSTFSVTDRFKLPTVKSRFICVFSVIEEIEAVGDKCTPVSISERERVLGIDIALNILTKTNNLGRENLIANVFWIGSPDITAANRQKARSLGFTDDEFASIASTTGIQDFDGVTLTIKVHVLEDPFLIKKMEHEYGTTDLGSTIERGPTKINLNPSTTDIFNEAKKILKKAPNAKTSTKAQDYASGPTGLMQIIDLNKTFDPDDFLSVTVTSGEDPCFVDLASLAGDMRDLLSDAHGFMNDVLSAVGAPQRMLNELMAGLSDAASGALNELTSVLGAINNTLGDPDFLKCSFGVGFSLDLEFGNILGPLDDLLSTLEDGMGIALDFLDLIADLLSTIGQLACIQASLTGGLTGMMGPVVGALASLGLNCVLNGPDNPKCLQEVLDLAALAADFAWNLLSAALSALRALHMSLGSLALSIRGNISTSAGAFCNPAETAMLTALLVAKKLSMEEILSL